MKFMLKFFLAGSLCLVLIGCDKPREYVSAHHLVKIWQNNEYVGEYRTYYIDNPRTNAGVMSDSYDKSSIEFMPIDENGNRLGTVIKMSNNLRLEIVDVPFRWKN